MGTVSDLNNNKTLFMPCGCRSEILMIEYDHEWKMADIAIYQTDVSFRYKMSLWQRLRYCWQVLWHKKPYADQIMMDHKQLKDLKNFLNMINLDH